MDWFILIIFFGILLLMVLLIGMLLYSLAKQGDERKNFIKAKAMSYTFAIIVGVLLIEIGMSIYIVSVKGQTVEGMSPFIFLVIISIVYLVTLLYNKRKYGN